MTNAANKKQERLLSLDALRGFDMFWIAGGSTLMITLKNMTDLPFFIWMADQMEHVKWDGFRIFDLIFPLFLFIAGVALPFSIDKRKKRGDSLSNIYLHMLIRLLLLIILGLIHGNILQFKWEEQRYASVLAHIGLAWFFAALIMLKTTIRGQIMWFIGILLAYWVAMKLIPVPGYGAGVLTQEGNLAGYIDRMLLPGKLYLGNHDPEGLFSTIPAVATALLGVITGQLLAGKVKKFSPLQNVIIMSLTGLIFLGLGKLWGLVFPINKNLWTSSFVLYAGGWSLLLLSLFYLIIDVWKLHKWSFPLVVIGLNSILIYMLNGGIFDFAQMSKYFFGGIAGKFSELAQPVILSAGMVLCIWTFLYILYRYKIFLKV
jgi:predicted acyltransferase